jgi:hypothetical protein
MSSSPCRRPLERICPIAVTSWSISWAPPPIPAIVSPIVDSHEFVCLALNPNARSRRAAVVICGTSNGVAAAVL